MLKNKNKSHTKACFNSSKDKKNDDDDDDEYFYDYTLFTKNPHLTRIIEFRVNKEFQIENIFSRSIVPKINKKTIYNTYNINGFDNILFRLIKNKLCDLLVDLKRKNERIDIDLNYCFFRFKNSPINFIPAYDSGFNFDYKCEIGFLIEGTYFIYKEIYDNNNWKSTIEWDARIKDSKTGYISKSIKFILQQKLVIHNGIQSSRVLMFRDKNDENKIKHYTELNYSCNDIEYYNEAVALSSIMLKLYNKYIHYLVDNIMVLNNGIPNALQNLLNDITIKAENNYIKNKLYNKDVYNKEFFFDSLNGKEELFSANEQLFLG